MKPKDATFFDLHIEKVVLAVAVLFALLVVWVYYLSQPYQITLNAPGTPETTVEPGEVGKTVYDKVQVLKTKIERPEPQLETPEAIRYTQLLRDRLSESLFGVEQVVLPPLGWPGLNLEDVIEQPPPPPDYQVPTPPSPQVTKVVSHNFVLGAVADPQAAARLAAVVGQRQPRDFVGVRIDGQWNQTAWVEALVSPPPASRIPPAWRNASAHLLTDVVLERSEQLADGSWGPPVEVDRLPTDVANFRDVPADLSPQRAAQLLRTVEQYQAQVALPPFVPVTVGAWPDGAVQPTDGMPADGGEFVDPGMGPMGQPSGGFTDEFGSIDRTPGAPMRRPPGGRMNWREPQPTNRPGMAPADGGRMNWREPQPTNQPGMAPADGSEPGEGQPTGPRMVDVRAYDITAQPGKTYRYRLRVAVLNPFYMKPLDKLSEAQRPQRTKLSMQSQASDWSEPVTIQQIFRFFAIDASERGATFEIYRMHGGQWRKDLVSNVEPGDPIGRLQQTPEGEVIDFRVNATLVDIVRMPSPDRVRPSIQVMYVEHGSSELDRRDPSADRNDPDRRRLNDLTRAPRPTPAGAGPDGLGIDEATGRPVPPPRRPLPPRRQPSGPDPNMPYEDI